MENINDPNSSVCFYCKEYNVIFADVPLNEAIYDTNEFTPRCFLHYKYECSNCEIQLHFNGLSWCHECKIFTCIKCTKETINKENFLIYDYYFKNQCIKCSKNNPTLDYAEFTGTHPYQIGDLWPKQPINIWIPMVEDGSIISSSIKLSGSLRIQNLSAKEIILIEHQIDDKITRTQLMNEWTGFLGEHHRLLLSNLFLPEMIKLVDPKPQERILEIGCGNGEMSRLIAHASSIVTGIDTSKNIEKAISQEKEVPLNITYHKSIIEDLIYNTNANMYDKIVCNLQIMIIQDAKSFFENAFYLLKLDGELVFSIPHPFFSLPNGVSIRIPADSNRNEDKFWMIDNYFSEGPVRILGDEKENNQIFFRRTLSTYLNNMTEIGFTLVQISEPQSKPELVSKFVSQMFNNTDRFPSIMIIRAKKKSKNY